MPFRPVLSRPPGPPASLIPQVSSPTPSCDRITASPSPEIQPVDGLPLRRSTPLPLKLSRSVFSDDSSSPIATPSHLHSSKNLETLRESLSSVIQDVRSLHQKLCIESQRAVAYRAAKSNAGVISSAGKGVGGGGEGEDCPVCLEKLRTPGSSLTRCGHMFHTHCILQHLESGSKAWCPLCRRELMRGELTAVMSGIAEGNGEEERAGVRDVDVDEVGKGADGDLARAVESVVEVMEEGKRLKEMARGLERERRRMRKQWEREVNGAKEMLERNVATVRRERDKLDKMTRDCMHERSELEGRTKELNDQIALLRKQGGELEMVKKEVEVERQAVGRERQRVAEEWLGVRKTKGRLEKFLKCKEREGETGSGGKVSRELKRENERLKRQVEELKKQQETAGEGMSVVFGDKLQRPSKLNRPRAPRKRGSSLSGFAPKRRKIEQPGLGIGERR